MDVVSVCPLRVASLRWRAQRAGPALTIVAKATFRLLPGTCALADEQEDPNEHENHWDDDPRRSLYSPADIVPFKPRPEVMLVGNAFAPRGEPVSRLTVRLIVGRLNKSLVIRADRSFSQDGSLRDGSRFARMGLRWERAAGGADTKNPVGIARGIDTRGAVHLPNLEPPGLNVTHPDDFIEPVGFGPIAADWPSRRERLAHAGGSYNPGEPLRDGLDPLFFMSAPADQHIDELRANERIVLENLNIEHPRLVTSLPGYEPRAFVERVHGAVAELPMTCDTLWIDTDRAVATLTWRALLALDDVVEGGRVVIAMEQIGKSLAWADVEPLVPRRSPSLRPDIGAPEPSQSLQRQKTLPFTLDGARLSPAAEKPRTTAEPDLGGTMDGPLPQDVRGMLNAPLVNEPTWLRSPPVPAVAPVAPPPVAPAWSRPLPSSPPLIAPPSDVVTLVPAPRPPSPIAMPSPWSPSPSPSQLIAAPSPAIAGPAPVVRDAATRGAAAASNAAAASAAVAKEARPAEPRPSVRPPPARDPGRDHVDLIWFDPDAVPRIRADLDLGQAPLKSAGAVWSKGEAGPREPQEAKDRRDLLAIFSKVAPLDEAGFARAAGDAYQEDGTLSAPLALIGGDLVFAFDEVEALRATITVTSPFAGSDKKLREAVEAATEALRSEWPVPADIAEGLTRRIEETFAQGQRAVAPGYLDSSVEKILLQARRYQKRTLFGEPRLRALLSLSSGAAAVPTYLPEALAPKLPLFRRFKARAIVEIRPQEDQYESHADALLLLALGRLIRRAS